MSLPVTIWEEPYPGSEGAVSSLTRAYLAGSSSAGWGWTTSSSDWTGSVVGSSSDGFAGIGRGQGAEFVAYKAGGVYGVQTPVRPEGRYRMDGAGAYLDYGDVTEFDGATQATWFLEIEQGADQAADAYFLTRWEPDAAARQFAFHRVAGANDRLKFAFATDLLGGVLWGGQANTYLFSAGSRLQVLVRLDLTGATDAERLKADARTWDPASLSYSAWSSLPLTYFGTAPASLTSPTSPARLLVGRNGGGSPWDGYIDDMRWTVGTTLSDADRDAITLSAASSSTWDHWWPYDGDAVDRIGSLNAANYGATQAWDGR